MMITKVGCSAAMVMFLAMPNAHAASGDALAKSLNSMTSQSSGLQAMQEFSHALRSGQTGFSCPGVSPGSPDSARLQGLTVSRLKDASSKLGPSAHAALISPDAQAWRSALPGVGAAALRASGTSGQAALAAEADPKGGDGLQAIASAAKPDIETSPAVKALSSASQPDMNATLQSLK